MKKVIIVGAGPVGSYAAKILSDMGYMVEVYEEHDVIGKPIQCTGVYTDAIKEMVDIPDDVLANEINMVSINSINNSSEIPAHDVVVKRDKFDIYMAKRAKNARFFFGYRFKDVKGREAIFQRGKFIEKVKFDFLIGADGPMSRVREIINPSDDSNKYIGVQAIVKGDVDRVMDRMFMYDTYFRKELDGFFGWVVPESKDSLRIGVVVKSHGKKKFDWFYDNIAKKNIEERGLANHKIVAWQGGFIPLYNHKLVVVKKNMAIIGDAATHVKATTFGGVVPGMKGAKEICGYVDSSLKSGISHTVRNSSLRLNDEMKYHLLLNKLLQNSNNRDFDKIVSLLNEESIKRLLSSNTRDNIKDFKWHCLYPLLKPKYWAFSVKMLYGLFAW